MNFLNKSTLSFCILSVSTLMYGCGSGSSGSTTGPSGKLTQGPVLGASVFADNVSAGSRFNLDSGEIATTSSMTTGDFVLPSEPTYNYILVSKGGTDKLTGQAAIQMVAPAGSANITPITTLVALDTTGDVKAKLEALMPAGTSFDADISTTASPAILLLAKSIESTVYAMTQAAVTSAGSATISSVQLASMQAQTMQAIAVELAKPAVTSATLQAPATLTTSLQAAVTSATVSINASNTNIDIPAATASTIAATVVDASATMLNVGTTALTTAITGGEAAVVTSATSATFTAAVTEAVTTASSTVTAEATPTDYVEPVILVVTQPTVTDATGATGGTSVGTGKTF